MDHRLPRLFECVVEDIYEKKTSKKTGKREGTTMKG